MTDLATLEQRLAQAEDAQHRLLTGQLETSIGDGTNSVAYGAFFHMTPDKLANYIRGLKRQIAQLKGEPLQSGSAQVYFRG